MKLPSVVHSCFSQHLNEKKPKKCRCRKRISLAEATSQVEKGFAEWLIFSTTLITGKETCPVCLADKLMKGCQCCKSTGEVEKTYPVRTHTNDIVLVSGGSPNEDGSLTYRSVKAKQTPRVATLERSHIEKAYIDGNQEEIERIEIYGLMILEARIEMGIKPEPADDAATGTGRKYDTGRAPFGRTADERTTQGGVGKRISEGFKLMDPYETDKDYR